MTPLKSKTFLKRIRIPAQGGDDKNRCDGWGNIPYAAIDFSLALRLDSEGREIICSI